MIFFFLLLKKKKNFFNINFFRKNYRNTFHMESNSYGKL